MNKITIISFSLLFIVIACNKSDRKKITLSKEENSLTFFFETANNTSLSFNERFRANNKALTIISSKKNDSLNRANYFKVANRYFNMNAMDDYKQVVVVIIKNSGLSKDTISLGKAYNYMGDYYGSKSISDSAYSYYLKAEKIYKSLKDNANIAKALLNKAILQLNEKDYVGSEKSAFESLKFLRTVSNDEMSYEANNILGIIYGELSEIKKSLYYHNVALDIANKNLIYPEYQATATTFNNLGYLYKNLNRHKDAIAYFEKGLEQKNVFKDKIILYANLKDNLAYSKFRSRRFEQLPKMFFDVLHINDSIKNFHGIIGAKLNLSEYYAYKKDTSKAIIFAEDAYKLAKGNKFAKEVLQSLKQKSVINPQNKVAYSEEYIRISDSLQLAERQIRNKLGRIEYDTETLAIEKANLVEQRKTLVYISLGIILIGVFIFVIRFQAAKNRELRLVQEQQAANEEIYRLMITQQDQVEETRQAEKKRIAQEIHDGVLGKLFGTRMHLGLLNDSDGSEAKAERVTYIDELKTLEQELREISHDLNSEKQAVANNFVQMVAKFIETQRTVCKATIAIEMDKKIDWTVVDSLAKINLYRILQEAFQNINKHAQAAHVTVGFTKQEGYISITVQDDGIGFQYAKKKKGIGMLNMQSRISSSGGSMVVTTAPGEGTTLEFVLPLKRQLVE